jgi:hypothetical protein
MPNNLETEITVIAPAYVWMTVLGNMQLALRHPENTGESAEIARQFGDALLEKLIAEGVFTVEEGLLLRGGAQIWRDDLIAARNRKTAGGSGGS